MNIHINSVFYEVFTKWIPTFQTIYFLKHNHRYQYEHIYIGVYSTFSWFSNFSSIKSSFCLCHHFSSLLSPGDIYLLTLKSIMKLKEDFSLTRYHMDNCINSKYFAKHFIYVVFIYPHNVPFKKAPLLAHL